jgi:hypothetical protein
MHREGFVVQFMPDGSEEWVGNFQPSLRQYSKVFWHPDQKRIIVVAEGQAYVIEPNERRVTEVFGGSIECAFELKQDGLIVFANGLWFEVLAAEGVRWTTKHLSCDGMRNVQIIKDKIVGEGCMFDESWHKFEVDLATGLSVGGACNGPGN